MATPIKRTDAVDPVKAFLESKGIPSDVLDREAPTVGNLDTRDQSPFGFIGSDAPMLLQHFRMSHVVSDRDIQRLLTEDFVVLADWRDNVGGSGKTQGADVYTRAAGKSGVVMGRPKKIDAIYKARRARRDHERRTGRSTDRQAYGGGGPMGGTMTTDSSYSPATVRDN